MVRKLFLTIIIIVLALLFAYTGIMKYSDLIHFKQALHSSPLLKALSSPIAIILPGIELFISILLFMPKFQRIALISSFILMTIFTAYITYMLYFTPDRPCI